LERTRIVLVDMPPLLREIVRDTLAREPDLDVVAEHAAAVDARGAVGETDADFLIIGAEATTTRMGVASVVGAQRGIRAIEVQSDGKESVLYELRPHRVSLGEMSPETLLRTIRTPPTWDGEA
jgi:DNA-binding NarL/FixJ family response regulator